MRPTLIVFGHFVFIFPWVLFLSYSGLVVSNSASDRLERVVLKVAYTVLVGTLNFYFLDNFGKSGMVFIFSLSSSERDCEAHLLILSHMPCTSCTASLESEDFEVIII